MQRLRRFLLDDRAATAIEYSLVAGLISIVIVATITTIGNSLQTLFYNKLMTAF